MINLHTPIQIQKSTSAALITEYKHSSVRKNTLSRKVELGMNSLVVLIGIFVLIISFLYLAHANKNATKGYALKTLEQERQELVMENDKLDMRIAEVRSLGALRTPEMVKVKNPAFIRLDTTFAQAE